MLVYIIIVVSLVCFILYVGDRRMREESIDWMTALKLTLIGGLLSGGTGYALGYDFFESVPITEVVEVAKDVAQEMFVGIPTF